MKKIISLGAVLGVVSPLSFVFAAASQGSFLSILELIKTIVGYLMPLLITIAAVWFVWSIIQYAISSDETKKKEAKKGIIQGLIGMFIIIAFWGIIGFFMNQLGIGTELNAGDTYSPIVPVNTSGQFDVNNQ